ncbi:MAG: hypothetical protein HC901_03500, partial [Bdellovibrionaceae bacterium]|nr:hypothetical protein [Pseudobdellovibrionaceae bacterium]
MSLIKKLRITLSGKTHDVTVEILDDDISPRAGGVRRLRTGRFPGAVGGPP